MADIEDLKNDREAMLLAIKESEAQAKVSRFFISL